MQVLRLLAPRRAAPVADSELEDDGPFFDLDFSSSSSVRASSSSAGSASGSDSSDDASFFTDLDIVISLHRRARSRSASPPSAHPRALSFNGATKQNNKAAFHAGRRSFARSSSGARSLRLFVLESPAPGEDEAAERRRAAPSGDVFRRYLTKITRRLRSVRAGEARGLRKSRSASAAVTAASSAPPCSRRDDSLVEKQDGIASAIAHCKESLHRDVSSAAASVSERRESSLSRSRSDPGERT